MRQAQVAITQISISRDLLMRREEEALDDHHKSVVAVLKEREQALNQLTTLLKDMAVTVDDVSRMLQ